MSTMPQEMFSKLRRSLIKHEGYERKPYIDSVGKITIGVGHNLSDLGVSDNFIDETLLSDIDYLAGKLSSTFYWFSALNEDRQIALIDMAFMGFKKFTSFEKMISAFEIGDFNTAANEMLNSEWAKQVKNRATDLAWAIKTGIYNV